MASLHLSLVLLVAALAIVSADGTSCTCSSSPHPCQWSSTSTCDMYLLRMIPSLSMYLSVFALVRACSVSPPPTITVLTSRPHTPRTDPTETPMPLSQPIIANLDYCEYKYYKISVPKGVTAPGYLRYVVLTSPPLPLSCSVSPAGCVVPERGSPGHLVTPLPRTPSSPIHLPCSSPYYCHVAQYMVV
eukprot:TRINITY_DN383_c0_g1_i3.p1 TRINITY_DN383_c0_g1~~TRINITY_DN383_c0_g1_i3.p1  ORF type:complete len:188 (+),score=3.17 TRINITY_DN383_c0_g1_i3:153-716(+)